jgi:ABC-type sugar transport system ATPase subunit
LFLQAVQISKKFPGVQALSEVDISLAQGEIHAVVGENGAGKSTLMNILIGLLKPDSGDIFIDSKKVVLHSPIDAQRMGIAIVPQEINLVPMLSVMENIFLGIEPRTLGGMMVDWKGTERDALALIERMGEKINPRRKIRDLPTAQRQLIQIARAFAFESKVLILDEPTASLTIRETENLFKIIRTFQSQGGAAFYISHRLEEIKEIADRVTVLRDGKKVTEMSPKTASVHDMIEKMVGKQLVKSQELRKYERGAGRTLLRVENLTRAGEFYDINLELHEGEILGIAGLVGAGRTELVKCIFGDSIPNHGEIYVESKKIIPRTPKSGIEHSIAYLPEERRRLGVFPMLTVCENMTLPMQKQITSLLGINKRKETAYAKQYVGKLNIKTKDLKEKISNLSGGNQQKVILSRWLLKGSKILILDEPTRGIDVNAKAEIHNLLKQLANKGIGIILISSELEEVIENADRILILHEGRLKGEVDPKQTSQEEILKICLT